MSPENIFIRPYLRSSGKPVKGHVKRTHRRSAGIKRPPAPETQLVEPAEKTGVNTTRKDSSPKSPAPGYTNVLNKMKVFRATTVGSKRELCLINPKTGLGIIRKKAEEEEGVFHQLRVAPEAIVYRECFMMDSNFSRGSLDRSQFMFDHMYNNAFEGASLNATLFVNAFTALMKGIAPEPEEMSERNFAWAGLEETSFKEASLKGAKFVNLSLREVDFSYADLSGAQFINTELYDVNFYESNIRPEQIVVPERNWASISYRQYSLEETLDLLNVDESMLLGLIGAGEIEVRDDYSHLPITESFDPERHHIPQWEIQSILRDGS